MRSDHGPAEEFTRFAVGEQFDEAVGFAMDDGFAVIAEGIGRGGEVDPEFGRFAFAQANHGGLGLGEDGEEAEAVVDGFEGLVFAAQEPCRIAGGNFALLDGDVDNFQFSGDVARAENMRDGGLLGIRGGEGTAGRCVETGGGEIKPGSGGVASEREQNFVCLKRLLPVVVRDAQPFPARVASDLEDSASKDKLGPVPLHAVLHRIGHIAVHRTEDLLAALDNGDVRPEGAMVVGHLEGDGTGTQDEERFRGIRII